jgi:ElaB/YqjD/DUF883 family membrane-anchored ribosome-binding protein
MSANRPDNDKNNTSTGAGTSGTTGGGAGVYGSAGLGATDAGTTRDTSGTGGAGSLSRGSSTTTSTGGGTGAATGLAAQAQQYGQKIAEAASTAKDYVTERAGVVGEKFQDLRNKDYGQMAEDAKTYARQNPGQALLISAAAGFLLGVLLRSRR